ncbi:hypothetical protein [Leifsonia sp. Leaf264]|uniref:hypothetical protein n=1 Tax=Leifsonia sp. Leaf264 TaxID=1736314 RepID=UPI0006F5C77A|nr:hypothetical protein [Leifsonia sp. Leaf264]KQP01403.1 hypothetical protein ASF30_01955 [Leifsonia sp. Leaf264]
MTNGITDRTGHEKWLIYCPQITPNTLLHLSIQGTSYALRDFTGHLIGTEYRSGAGQPFQVHDEAGRTLATTAEFERAFDFEWKVDVYDEGVALTKVDRWRDIITRRNLRLGIG